MLFVGDGYERIKFGLNGEKPNGRINNFIVRIQRPAHIVHIYTAYKTFNAEMR